jgi:hypothetical protein
VTLKDFEVHKIDGRCNLMKEIESGKALRELAKF